MKKIKLVILLNLIVLFSFAQDRSVISSMSMNDIDSMLTETAKQKLSVTEKMNMFSEMFLGMEYNLKCTGDGKDSQYEPWPLVNLQQTNCMAYCEHVLALSISDSWDNFFNNLQQIRYKDGIIGIKSRNHYTMADWMPENEWLLKDVTKEFEKRYRRNTTRTISHKEFFATKNLINGDYIEKDETLTIDYLKLFELNNVKNEFDIGDILVLIYKGKKNIFAAHMVMVMHNGKEKVIREATTKGMTTIDTEISAWIKNKQENSKDRYLGVSVLRVKDYVNTNRSIILPWEIIR